jgi:class 3 adenylate cyclase
MRSQRLTILRNKAARVLTFAVLTFVLALVFNWYAGKPFRSLHFVWLLFGLLVGAVEQFFFQGAFGRLQVMLQLLLRLAIIYGVGMVMLSLILLSDSMPDGPHARTWDELLRLLVHPEVVHVIMNGIVLAFFVSIIMDLERLVGTRMFRRYITGRYAHPRREDRVVMFIDLEDSTRLTEQLGDERYFALLNHCFERMAGPILANEAEVLKYVGDAVIFTWPARTGLRYQRCLHLFFDIRQALERDRSLFMKRYGVFPQFHGAVHRGDVIVAQVGTIKRSIDLSGDAMNTCARLTSVAKEMGGLVVSADVLHGIGDLTADFRVGALRELDIRGKEQAVSACAVERVRKPEP